MMQKQIIMSKNRQLKRLIARLSPTLVRVLSDSKSFCTFADVKQYPNGRGKAAT